MCNYNETAKKVPSWRSYCNEEDKPTVFWIVSEGNGEDADDGEFGVEINGIPYFYYKWPNPEPWPSVKYRRISKREFGETIRRENLK